MEGDAGSNEEAEKAAHAGLKALGKRGMVQRKEISGGRPML